MTTAAPIGREISDSILDTIGETPLVRLSRVGAGPASAARREARGAQPGRLDQGPRRRRADRGGRARRPAAPGGTIVEPTSGNTGTGLAIAARAEGLPRDRRDAGQDEPGEDRPAARLRRRGGRRADRRPARLARVLLPRGRPAHRGDPGRLPAQPVLPTRPTRRRTTARPGRSCGASPAAGSRTSWSASARAARSPASAATSRSSNPDIQVIGADPVGSIYSGDEVKPYLVEGVGEDFWPDDLRPHGRRPLRDRVRQGLVPDDAPARAEEGILAGGSCGLAAARRARGGARDRRSRARWSR